MMIFDERLPFSHEKLWQKVTEFDMIFWAVF